MHRQACIVAGGIVCCLVLGCAPHGVLPSVTGASPDEISREMGKLAFLAYVGDTLPGSAQEVEARLGACMPQALAAQAGDWELVWGPVVYRFRGARFDDNMMYVAREKENPSVLAVVVRGTNPPALADWLAEDLDVEELVSWPAGAGEPKISKATSEGLEILLRMAPASDPRLTLKAFLAEQAAASSTGLSVRVTGHSLGGALAPTLALWLYDNRSSWDPQGKAALSVYPLAGPTPGNADFAAYYGSALGKTTNRLWNPFDIVPLAWSEESLAKMADLYEPFTRADAIERGLIDGLRALARGKDYTQILPEQESLSGAVFGGEKSWGKQAGWQHHCGYECALGIRIDASAPGCPSSRDTCDCAGAGIAR